MSDARSPEFAPAISKFLSSLPGNERKAAQQALYHFARWFGLNHRLDALTPPEIANYVERLSQSDADYSSKLEQVRAFLVYAKKEGWRRDNLSVHLRTKKVKARAVSSGAHARRKEITVSREGYQGILAELEALKCRQLEVIDEIRRAAADKDFRENAPLEAAREEHGRITGRIRELEEALKLARVVEGNSGAGKKADVGSTLRLKSLDSGEEMVCTIVGPREVDPARGRISSSSPVGKALMGHERGDTIEVVTPGGRHRYQVIGLEA
ncbi:MAG: transcription elongation factor GreA [Dehalococcoidia bacterium]|nr:MAG: transcription elongation factor GreA [Dehalococcoidia bacterium]